MKTRPRTHIPALADGMRFARRPTGIIMGLIVVLAAMVLSSIPAATIELFAKAGAQTMTFVSLFGFAIAVGVLALWMRVKERRALATVGFLQTEMAWKRAVRGAAIGVLLVALCVLPPVLLGQASLEWVAPQNGARGILVVVGLLLAFIVQGSTEEILNRGYLTQVFARRWGLTTAIILQAVFFMAMHGMNPGIGPMPILNLLLVAFFLSFWSLAEGSLWGVCAFHATWNWAQGSVFGVSVSGGRLDDTLFTFVSTPTANELLTGGEFGIEGSLLTTLVLATGTFIAYRSFAGRQKQ